MSTTSLSRRRSMRAAAGGITARLIKGGVGHNLPQEAPQSFAAERVSQSARSTQAYASASTAKSKSNHFTLSIDGHQQGEST